MKATRENIMQSLRSISMMTESCSGSIGGRVDVGLSCTVNDFDDALESISNTHWFVNHGNQFLLNKVQVTFYVL